MKSITRPYGIAQLVAALTVLLWLGAHGGASAATCGGAVPCQCGDTVTSNYTMTSDLGPCPRLATGDTIGLRVVSDVTLDCQNHSIIGPGDMLKNSFGIRVGTSSVPHSDVVVTRCAVTGFWWGIYVVNAGLVLVEDNDLVENGWKDPTANGTGYGINVTNSEEVTVRNNRIIDNGNEGIHLSDSVLSTIEDNEIRDNGREQLYMIDASFNTIRNNRTGGGTQGLEMRRSSNNYFEYNRFTGSPLHWLEDDNLDNTFFYETFEGRVVVADGSNRNMFYLTKFTNPTGTCLNVSAVGPETVIRSHFVDCDTDLLGPSTVTLERSASNGPISKTVVVRFPGCTADIGQRAPGEPPAADDGNRYVDGADRLVVEAAMNTTIGDPGWNPEADVNLDGRVDAADLTALDLQLGPCAANLTVTAVSYSPATAAPGSAISVTNTVKNLSRFAATKSRTQYFLSADPVKGPGDKLLGGRSVPAIAANQQSIDTISLTIPAGTAVGSYRVLACADDTEMVEEANEEDNCLAATAVLQVGKPDLVVTDIRDVPATMILGDSFRLTDVVRNQSAFPAAASRMRYWLSVDPIRGAGDKLLSGARVVPALAPGASSTDDVNVGIPVSTTPGAYFLLACADDLGAVPEADEGNNCLASAAPVQVGRPDLKVIEITSPSTTAVRGTSISVTDTVKNDSLIAAGSSRVYYYLSVDGTKNLGDRLLTGYRVIASLDPGEDSTGTRLVKISVTMAPGTYWILACADATSAVDESNEGNNCLASTATITVTE